MVFARNDGYFNEQFGEDDDERAERMAKARLAARCPLCGRNPKLGQTHTEECPKRPNPSPFA